MDPTTVKRTSGQTHIWAECHTCGKTWDAKNAHGVAARHAQAHGHKTVVDVCYSYAYNDNRPT